MTIKVARTILGNLAATGLGNPMMFMIPIIFVIAVIPLWSLYDDYTEHQEFGGFTNSTATESYQTSIATSLMLIIFLPIMLLAVLIPFLTGGIGGSPNIRGIIKTANIEKRMEKLKKLGAAEFVKGTHAELIDSSARGNKLWATKDVIFGKELRFLIYQDKSTTREYISFVPAKFSNADEAMAWKFNLSNIEYDKLTVEHEA